MKKFLIFSNYLPSVLNLRGSLLETISKLGYQIYILAPNPNMHPAEYNQLVSLDYNIYPIPLERTGTNPIEDIQTIYAAFKAINKIKPDAILSYTIKPVIYGTLAAYWAKTPKRFALLAGLGYTFQNNDNQVGRKSILKKVAHKLYKQSLSKSTKVFFQNPDDLKLLQDMKILKSCIPTIVVNGSGVDTNQYDTTPFPIDTSGNIKPSFLLIARLLKDKGIREYIEAAKMVQQKYPSAEFHLVGWIDENPEAISQTELEEWVDSGVINYWGKLTDVKPAIATCSVYVLPSYREGTPRSVLEAMSMGRPIITTNAPGCKETVIEGKNGFLVPVKDIDELASAMLKFIQKPTLYQSMGKASRQLAEQKYDVHKVNEHMISEMGL